jgi:hypothetical protein
MSEPTAWRDDTGHLHCPMCDGDYCPGLDIEAEAAAGSRDEGLREAAQRVMDSHRKGYWSADEFDALEAALAKASE